MISLSTTGVTGLVSGLTTDGVLSGTPAQTDVGWVMGYGEPTAIVGAPEPPAYFGWGWGDPDPDTLHAAASSGLTWSGTEIEWGYGDPAVLSASWISWLSPDEQPDDGGEIVELQAEWPEIGPWRITLEHHFTGAAFPPATAPQIACQSPVPGFGTDCYTNVVTVEIAGTLVEEPGTKLRVALPVLPPGVYDVHIRPANSIVPPIVLAGAFRVIRRGRAMEVYSLRRRFPAFWQLGPRLELAETLLGIDPESDVEVT